MIATTATTTASALKPERQDVGEDEVEPEQDDAELEHGTGRDGRGRERPRPGRAAMFASADAEADAEDERGQARKARVGAERHRDPGSRKSEAGRPAHHSSGCRNG